MLFLDNDVLARFARPDPDPAVVDYLKEHSTDPWAISALVAYEFASFYPRSRQQAQLRRLESEIVNEVTPIDSETSLEAATIESLLGEAGTSLDTGDLLVAATARQHDGTLATANKNDFDKSPIHQLMDVDIVRTT
ncbi:MAG: type II toxin-antitoxin system VapC family toxin [Halobacteriales archaeon]